MTDSVTDLRALVSAVRATLEAKQPDATAHTIETHISIVLLHGQVAYKFKKPVDLGFADFSTLSRRHHLCGEELRLNRRLAPEIYLGLTAIRGPRDAPVLEDRSLDAPGGTDPTPAADIIEYAVRMRRFADDARLDCRVEAGRLTTQQCCRLAADIAAFHRDAQAASPESHFASPALVEEQIMASLEQGPPNARALAPQLRHRVNNLRETFAGRRRDGFVRDCHGDLHLANLVALDDTIKPFDCIEFNRELRVIDVVADLAFLVMDLDYRGRSDLANAVLGTWFEQSGDYGGLRVAATYLTYRALIRAKVAGIQANSAEPDDADSFRKTAERYARLARSYLEQPATPALWITHGLSGSGKSYVASRVAGRTGWLHLRSDVERKRLLGLDSQAATGSRIDSGAYAQDISDRTYETLKVAAGAALEGGFGTIVDATFLSAARRTAFAELARRHGARFRILHCEAPEAVLRERIRQRAAHGADPSEATEAVLDAQLQTVSPLSEEELAVSVDAARVLDGSAEALRRDPPRPGMTFEADARASQGT